MHPGMAPQERVRSLREAAAALALRTALGILRRCSKGKWADLDMFPGNRGNQVSVLHMLVGLMRYGKQSKPA